MKLTYTLVALAAMAATSQAAITHWQAAAAGIASNVTNSSATVTTSGAAYDFGTLTATGGQSIEFIANFSGASNPDVLGAVNNDLGGAVSFRFETWNGNNFGVTEQGIADADFGTASAAYDNLDTHILFTNNAGSVNLFVNGVASGSVTMNAQEWTGGVGNLLSNLGGSDATTGTILGVASYDTALSVTDAVNNYNAYVVAVPEPSSTALLGLGGLALILRRRK